MIHHEKPSKALHRTLWTAQLLVAACLLMGAIMKFMPIEKIAAMMPWTGELPPLLVRLLGVADLAGAVGLILPPFLRTKPDLTPWAAIGVIALMLSAIVFHVLRGEASVIGFNIFLLLVCVFIAWGRFKKAAASGSN